MNPVWLLSSLALLFAECRDVSGLLNTDNNSFVASFIEAAGQDFDSSLAAADCNRSRLLLRLFAALAAVNVLHPTSVLAALQSALDAAATFTESGLC